VSWLAVSTASSVPGLVVSVGATLLELGATPQSVPVDRGEVMVTAHAPGFKSWTSKFIVGNAEFRKVVVPALIAETPEIVPPLEHVPTVVAVSPPPLIAEQRFSTIDSVEESGSRRSGPPVLLSVGGSAAVAGAVGLGWSLVTYGQLQQQRIGALNPARPTVTQGQFNTLHWMYPAAWTLTGVGLVAVAAGTLWSVKERRTSLSVSVGPGTAGLTGTF
jgi:hypothetical protein